MTSIDITLQKDKAEIKDIHLPIIEFAKLKAQTLNVIGNFLQGTESNEWLIDAENA